MGVYSGFWRVLLRDAVLVHRVWYGPMFSAQYRLLGPDSDWDTSRAACYRAHEVLTANASSRGKVEVKRNGSTTTRRLLLLVLSISAVAAVSFVGKSRSWFGISA